MPSPVFHLAFGALPKSVLGRNFSFTAFAGANALMNLEPALKMYAGLPGPLHGPTHTWPGALVIAAIAVALFIAWQRYGPARILDRIGRANLAVVIVSVLVGTLSHVWLDAMMHADMNVAFVGAQEPWPNTDSVTHPYIPFSEALSMLAFTLALVIWPLRLGLSLAFRQFYKLVAKQRSPGV